MPKMVDLAQVHHFPTAQTGKKTSREKPLATDSKLAEGRKQQNEGKEEKDKGETMSERETKKYFIKYSLALAVAHLGLTTFIISMFLNWQIGQLDNSNKALQKTVQKMEKVDDSFQSILRMERLKEGYRQQGIMEDGL